MRVSVVICTYNRARSLATLLDSLKYQRHRDFEVVVVNGPSTDDTGDVLATRRESIRVVDNPVANLSISRNLGIRASAGEVIAFLDDDAIPEPAWLQQASGAFRDADVAGVGGIVFDHTGVGLQYHFSTASRFGEPSFSDVAPLDSRCLPGGTSFPYLQGTNALFRRTALDEIGRFDETFDFYLDETDLCCRLVDRGFLLRQVADAPVHHKFLPSDRRNEHRVTTNWYSIVRNHVYFGYRHALDVNADEAQILEHAERFVDYVVDNADYHERLSVTDAGHTERARRACEDGLADGIALGKARHDVRLVSVELDDVEFQRYPTHDPGRRVALVLDELTDSALDSVNATAANGDEIRVITRAREWPTVDFERGVWIHRVIAPGVTDPMPHARAELDRIGSWFEPDDIHYQKRDAG